MKRLFIFSLAFTGLAKAQTNDTILPFPQLVFTDFLSGDFSFKDEWSYHEGVYVNQWGQLSCDGICPEESWGMKDSLDRILPDSLNAFYEIVDTTHRYHTLSCESSCSEFAGSDFMHVVQINPDSFLCLSLGSVATHCALHITFNRKTVLPKVYLMSIVPDGDAVYECVYGFLRIEKKDWERGIMKADFYFSFENVQDQDDRIYWKGLIYSEIKKK